jgi:hypothetical protein
MKKSLTAKDLDRIANLEDEREYDVAATVAKKCIKLLGGLNARQQIAVMTSLEEELGSIAWLAEQEATERNERRRKAKEQVTA